MIVSFRHNFIFIKTRKTAGTSVEIALTPFCGPDDILTLISLEDEVTRLAEGQVAARNYCKDPRLEARIAKAVLAGDSKRFNKLKRKAARNGALRNHLPASRIKARVPADFWDRAFKFTLERHPYEKAVSSAFWRYRDGKKLGLEQAIAERVANRSEDLSLYTIAGEVVVDEIIQQENLAGDLSRVAARLGLPHAPEVPRAKGNTRTDRRPAREILSDEQKAIIYERHRRTFDLMGYEP